ncbi:hypothetical protein ACMT1E_04315 [Sphingomonas flavalba]|uniref:hypothetical protein n=1 Tax=Sphingomonas flavalba TaxID=2559804 RepID=UPI0039E08D3B
MAGPAAAYTPRPPEPGAADLGPDIGFFDRRSWSTGFAQAQAGPDIGTNETRYTQAAGRELRDYLRKRGYPVEFVEPTIFGTTVRGSGFAERFIPQGDINRPLFDAWAQLTPQERSGLPDFADVVDGASLRALAIRRQQADARKAAIAAGRLTGGGKLAAFLGAVGAAYDDPESYIGIGMGAAPAALTPARRILSVGLREGALNAGIAVASEPLVQRSADRLGVGRTAEDAAFDIVVQGLAGVAIGGGIQGIGEVAHAIRARRVAAGTEADRALVAQMRAAVPDANMTPDERAAMAVLERSADVTESSPFSPGGAGAATHVDRLGRMMDDMALGRPITAPVPETVSPADVAAGAVDPARLRAPARAQFMARVRAAESAGNDAARPIDPRTGQARSSATGRYQFTDATWLAYFKRRYGGAGLSDAAILARRGDGAVQDVLMHDLTDDHAAALDRAGQPETAGSLYLLHFAGEKGGLALLRAAPDTPVERLLSEGAIRANPFLKGRTAAEVIAWADRKMGQAAPTQAVVGGRPGIADDVLPTFAEAEPPAVYGEPTRADLRVELFDSPEAHARAQLDQWRADDAIDGLVSVEEAAPSPPAGPSPQPLSAEVKALMPRLRDVVADRRASLNAAKLASKLDATEADVRRALEALVSTRQSGLILGRSGSIRRALQRRGPVDAITFIGDRGGLLDNEGHDLVKGRGLQRMVSGSGPLFRRGGMSIDRAGELLHEAGYFGPPSTTERPDVAGVLDYIERASAQKQFAATDLTATIEAAGAKQQAYSDEALFAAIDDNLASNGFDYDDAMLRMVYEQAQENGGDIGAAIDDVLAFEFEQTVRAAAIETDSPLHAIYADQEALGYGGRPASEIDDDAFEGFAAGAGDPRESGAGQYELGGAGANVGGEIGLSASIGEEAGLAKFSDPVGPEARAQSDSLAHDLQMDAFGGAGPADRRLVLERQAEGRIRSAKAQKAPGSEGGLFDTRDTQQTFRLDENSDDVGLPDLLKDLDDDIDAAATLRGCMAPPGKAGGA